VLRGLLQDVFEFKGNWGTIIFKEIEG